MHLLSGQLVDGKYRLESELSRGGNGAVWRARRVEAAEFGGGRSSRQREPTADSPYEVAVKVVRPDRRMDPASVERSHREARLAMDICSPHVVRVLDCPWHGGLPVVVMELVRGTDLRRALRVQRRLSLTEVASIVAGVCAGLTAIHDRGLVHRDIKPSNIMLSAPDGRPVLLDLGAAKPIIDDEFLTQTGRVVGTLHYMSPEHLENYTDPLADLWSCAVVAYECLTGHLPFNGRTYVSVLERITGAQFVRPRLLSPSLPRGVDEWFEQALNRNPTVRFSSAAALANAFLQVAGTSGDGAPERHWRETPRTQPYVRPGSR